MNKKIIELCASVLQIPHLYTQEWDQTDDEGRKTGTLSVEMWWLATINMLSDYGFEKIATCHVQTDQGAKGIIVLMSDILPEKHYVPKMALDIDGHRDLVSEALNNVNLLYSLPEQDRLINPPHDISIQAQTANIYSSINLIPPVKKTSNWHDVYTSILQTTLDFQKLYNDQTITKFIDLNFVDSYLKKQLSNKNEQETSSLNDHNENVW